MSGRDGGETRRRSWLRWGTGWSWRETEGERETRDRVQRGSNGAPRP